MLTAFVSKKHTEKDEAVFSAGTYQVYVSVINKVRAERGKNGCDILEVV